MTVGSERVPRRGHRNGGRHDECETWVEVAENIEEANNLRRVDHLRDGEAQAEQQAGCERGEYGGHGSEANQVSKNEAGHDGCRHEQPGRHYRAGREPRDTTDAVTAGAAAAETRAEADEEPSHHDERPRDRNRDVRQFTPRHPVELRCGNQSDKESNPPCNITYPGCPQTADNATDTSDPTVGEPHQGSGKP